MSDRISNYVQKRLLARLGLPAAPFALERCQAGVHGEIYFLTVQGRAPMVLKLYEKRSRLRTAAANVRLLAGFGIAVPPVIDVDEGGWLFGRRGMHVLCQERIAGESLERLPRTPEIITAVAQLFSAMHALRRPAWGDLSRGRTAGLHAHLQKKMLVRLDGWSACDEIPAALRKKILDAAAAGGPAMARIGDFSLSHTDPNRNNIIMRGSDRKLFLLDTGSLRYLPRAIDYYMLQAYFCLDSPEHAALFEEVYFRGVSEEEVEAFRRSQHYCRLYVIVLFVHDLTTRFAALDPCSPYHGEFARLIPRAKQALFELLEGGARC